MAAPDWLDRPLSRRFDLLLCGRAAKLITLFELTRSATEPLQPKIRKLKESCRSDRELEDSGIEIRALTPTTAKVGR